jgi:hypothetical protein
VDPTADLLVKLPSLNKPRLRELWQKSFNRQASTRLRRELMLPILAFRIQELSQGGLPAQSRAKLTETIGMLSTNNREIPRRFRPGKVPDTPEATNPLSVLLPPIQAH